MTYEEAVKRINSGHLFDPDRDKEILKLADNRGWTVAHVHKYIKTKIETAGRELR